MVTFLCESLEMGVMIQDWDLMILKIISLSKKILHTF